MDAVLLNFLLQSIGIPVVSAIVKRHHDQSTLDTLTSEQVIKDFYADVSGWQKQGKDWLAANPG